VYFTFIPFVQQQRIMLHRCAPLGNAFHCCRATFLVANSRPLRCMVLHCTGAFLCIALPCCPGGLAWLCGAGTVMTPCSTCCCALYRCSTALPCRWAGLPVWCWRPLGDSPHSSQPGAIQRQQRRR
jgi:hypothetical protein